MNNDIDIGMLKVNKHVFMHSSINSINRIYL